MKNKDKFGFALTEIRHEKRDGRRNVRLTYLSEDEKVYLCHTFNKQEVAKNPSCHRQYEENVKKQDIIETFAFEIVEKYLQYGHKVAVVYEDIVSQLPKSIITNRESIREFCSYLPNDNRLLVVVMGKIQSIRNNLSSDLEQ